MPRGRDQAGTLWEYDGLDQNGEPINPRMVQPAMSAAPSAPPGSLAPRGTFIPKPVDPYKAKADIRADASDRREEERLRLAKEAAGIDAAKAAREAAKDQLLDPKLRQSIKDLQLDDMLYAVQRARSLVKGGGATGIVGQFTKPFYGSRSNDLQGAINTIGGNTLLDRLQALKEASATGASGLGQLSNREGEYLRDSVASLKPEMSGPAILDGLARVERHILSLKAIEGGQNPDDPKVQKTFGIISAPPKKKDAAPAPSAAGTPPPPPGAPPAGGETDDPNSGVGLTKARTQTVADPALKGVNAHVKALLRAGRGTEVPAYLESIQPGLSNNPGIAPNLPQWIKFIDQHPGYKGSIDVNLELKEIPVGAVQNTFNRLGQAAPLGVPVGATALGMGDAAAFGALDNLTDNPALTRAGMSQIQAEHPGGFLAGQVGGMAAQGALGELGLASRGLGAGKAALLSDALTGAAYGYGSNDEGSRLGGALAGGLAGVIGNRAGAGLARVVGGVANPLVRRLAQSDIRLTPGQLFGGMSKSLEDRLSGFWGIGDLIRGQRKRGVEDFNKATLGEAVEPIGGTADQIGEAGVNDALDAYSQFTDKVLGPARVSVDAPFAAATTALGPRVAAIPEVGPTLHRALDGTITPLIKRNGGGLSGLDMQAIDRGLNDISASYKDHPLFATDIRPAIEDARSAVEGMFERQMPDLMPDYRASKEAYKRISTAADATNAAVNHNGIFLPSQLGTAARNNAKRFGGRNAAASGERPFFDLQRAGQNVLPSQIPDSGTAGRLALIPGALALGGGGAGAATAEGNRAEGAGVGTALGGLGGLALLSPYASRPVLQKLLTAERNPIETIIADYIRKTRLPGALAVPLLAGPQVP